MKTINEAALLRACLTTTDDENRTMIAYITATVWEGDPDHAMSAYLRCGHTVDELESYLKDAKENLKPKPEDLTRYIEDYEYSFGIVFRDSRLRKAFKKYFDAVSTRYDGQAIFDEGRRIQSMFADMIINAELPDTLALVR